jgi:hypothetical protein
MNDVALVEKALDKLQAEVGDKIVELDAKVRDLAQKSAPGWGPGDGGTGGARKSLGDAVRTEQFKALLAGQTRSATATLAMDIKSTITGDTGSPPSADDVMSPATRVPGIVSGAVRRLQVADLIPRVAVASNQAAVTVESLTSPMRQRGRNSRATVSRNRCWSLPCCRSPLSRWRPS